jgi:hypothetical protein
MKLNKIGAIMSIVIGLCAAPTQGEVTSASRMKEVQTKIEALLEIYQPEDIWVAFDIDMTLIQPDHPAVYYPNVKKYRDVFKSVVDGLTPEQQDMMITLLVLTVNPKLVESDSPKIVRELQIKGVKTFAFTATLTGKFSINKDKVIFMRKNQLQKMGYDFSVKRTNFPLCAPFMELPAYAGYYPIFYQGVLSSNGEQNMSKGEALVVFLKHMGQKHLIKTGKGHYPRVVILVDDRMKNLRIVAQSLKAYDPSIQFIGIEYQGAFSYAPKDISKEDFKKFWENLAALAKAEKR